MDHGQTVTLGMTPMRIANYFRPVNTGTLSQLHDVTLDILSETGIVFQSDECLEIFNH